MPVARSLPSLRSSIAALTLPACALLGACQESEPEGGELFASEIIGPDGGQVAGGSVTLDIPAGALSTDTQVQMRRSDALDLSLPGYPQSGAVVSLFPEDLILDQPAALTFADERDRPVVIFEQDSLEVVAHGQTAYINEFSRAAAAVVQSDDVVPYVTFNEPMLTAGPDTSAPAQGMVHMEVELSDPASVNIDVVLSVYDIDQAHGRLLKGTGEGECGFRLVDITGGSLRSDCSDSQFTATLRSSGTTLGFDIEPFQANNLSAPVAVGVVVGSSEIAFQGGFFGFET